MLAQSMIARHHNTGSLHDVQNVAYKQNDIKVLDRCDVETDEELDGQGQDSVDEGEDSGNHDNRGAVV